MTMASLRDALTASGCRDVRSYLQSGNVVLRAPTQLDEGALPALLASAIERISGHVVTAFVQTPDELRAVIEGNPFPAATTEPRSLHVFFAAEEVSAEALQRLAEVARPSERLDRRRRAVYLHAPDGIGRSKLVASAERRLGLPVTARNWRTVTQVLSLAERPPFVTS